MLIENSEILEGVFGRWPSFHDAEIHRILLVRNGETGAQLDVTIHLWQMTNEVDGKGFFVLKNHTLATLRFIDIEELDMVDFNQQNVLFDLEITEAGEKDAARYTILMRPSYGCGASFKCKRIKALEAVPYSK